jgi:hypothetical protein
MSATARRPPAPDAARLEDLEAELLDAGLRPIIDSVLRLVLADCPECRAQDRDPLGLWRPLNVIPRDGRTWLVCTACGREDIR